MAVDNVIVFVVVNVVVMALFAAIGHTISSCGQ